MPKKLQLFDTGELRPTVTALALNLVTRMDLLRLKSIARLHARGLPPDVSWDDLLQEAMTRVLTGARRAPVGVPIVAFLAGIMRSLSSEHWRRVRRHPRASGQSQELDALDPAPGPERHLSARQELAAISALFADDPVALQIIAGLAESLTAEQIRAATGISKTDYDSARKRMRRCLLREGLTCGIA
ncbi:MAG TPA: sigma-70 family RNA polymerase sigma factor [Steroidobacteraceae bacterium]|jgi:RNA polymerase sigma-70 factor (ECF subfamily)|nr:sigma-70 family RNA polymerase sigma factor [Steroidobacteraceae bacterium]